MADVRAFRGVRYSAEIARNLGNLIAPPYDVTTPHLIEDLRERDPHNMVHLEHVEVAPGHDPHRHAAELYREWRDDSVMVRDARPALYRYDHTFTLNGQRVRRRGVLAAVRLAPWSEREVLPHEETFPGPKLERLRRLRAVQANLSPLYMLFRDPDHVVREQLEKVGTRSPDESGIDPEGDQHELTRIDDAEVIAAIQDYLAGQPLYVADGHHRYEAAVEYRDERAEAGFTCPEPSPDVEGAEQFVLALLCATDDPGVMVLPTHRIVTGLDGFDPRRFLRDLSNFFEVEQVSVAPVSDPDDSVCLILFSELPGYWRVRLRSDRAHVALMPNEKSKGWQDLNIAILTSALIQGILRIPPAQGPRHITYSSSTVQVLKTVKSRQAQLAFLVAPSTVNDLITIADAGDKMPPKSTYFWPKVPAGLVIHDLC